MPKRKFRQFHRPKGMHDILPDEWPYWGKIYKTLSKLSEDYGFSRIDTPILEETDLYIRSTGEGTDIVEKQMYNLKTKGGDYLTLRPEGTPGIVRAYIENGMIGMSQPVKLYYVGPFFRYEAPQHGRYREFHQWGLEAIGGRSPVLDAQIIFVFYIFLKELGIKNLSIQINSIGCKECRPGYRRALVAYYKYKKAKLCSDCRRRLSINPLRLLDCKNPSCQNLVREAPQVLDYLCDDCKSHFKNVLEFLDELELPYFLNPHLVRGLDYYTKTVFEILPEEGKDLRQSALAAGGRFDNLVEFLGGKPTPAVGGALGIERVISLMKTRNIKAEKEKKNQIFFAQLGDLAKKKSLKIIEKLRKSGFSVISALSKDSIKSQLKIANKYEVDFSLILGHKEALEEKIIIRDMNTGIQEVVKLNDLAKKLRQKMRRRKRV